MTLGEKIQELRRRSSMSQDSLAEKLDVSRQAVSKWERDEAVPETDKIVRLAQVFGVSTDYLLMEEQPLPPPQAEPRRGTSVAERIVERAERFARRHGYKAGYLLIAAGALVCIIALLVMILVPTVLGGMFDSAKTQSDGWSDGVYIEGDVPDGLLDAIYGQAGSGVNTDIFSGGIFGSLEDEYNQQVDAMQSAWQHGVTIMVILFGVPVLLIGIGLITLGVFVVVKGKKYAREV